MRIKSVWELKPKKFVFLSANIAINPEKKIISMTQNIILILSLKISCTFLRIYPPKKIKEIKVVIKLGLISINLE